MQYLKGVKISFDLQPLPRLSLKIQYWCKNQEVHSTRIYTNSYTHSETKKALDRKEAKNNGHCECGNTAGL